MPGASMSTKTAHRQRIWIGRTKDVAYISAERRRRAEHDRTTLRAAGLAYDNAEYSVLKLRRIDFACRSAPESDLFARYMLRIAEIARSLKPTRGAQRRSGMLKRDGVFRRNIADIFVRRSNAVAVEQFVLIECPGIDIFRNFRAMSQPREGQRSRRCGCSCSSMRCPATNSNPQDLFALAEAIEENGHRARSIACVPKQTRCEEMRCAHLLTRM